MSLNVQNRSNPPALLPVTSSSTAAPGNPEPEVPRTVQSSAKPGSILTAETPYPLYLSAPKLGSDELKAALGPYATRATASRQAFADPHAAAIQARLHRTDARRATAEAPRPIDTAVAGPLTPRMAEALKVLSSTPSVDPKDPSKVNPAYEQAIESWPDAQAIWPHLQNREARESLVRYIVATDDTQKRDPYSFSNLCTGFSSQLYMRYSDSAPTDKATVDALKTEGKIDAGSTPNKLRVPLLTAITPGHAFNAFLVNQSRPNDINSYMLYEPQRDWLMKPGHPWYDSHVGTFGVKISDMDYGDHQGHKSNAYDFNRNQRDFLLTPSGGLAAENTKRMSFGQKEINPVADLVREFGVAEQGAQNWEQNVKTASGKGTFEDFIRGNIETRRRLTSFKQATGPNKGQVYKADERDLVKAAYFVVGRSFRTTIDAPPEKITADRYFQIIGRPDLRAMFQP